MVKENVIISFSSRRNGVSEQISEYLSSKICNIKLFKFSDFYITPCGRCSYQCFSNRESCPYIDDMEVSMLEAICDSELTIFIVPNYSGYPCANFFIFNERSMCFFQHRPKLLEKYEAVRKKFIAISNTEIDNIEEAFSQHTYGQPDVMQISLREYSKTHFESDVLLNTDLRDRLSEFVVKTR